jgi:tRNA(Ile2) C34 agmatinyltransferase TiaS
VAELQPSEATYQVVCPHCGKTFRSELLDGATARHHGFKCPHCKLFVPYERAEEQALVDRVD